MKSKTRLQAKGLPQSLGLVAEHIGGLVTSAVADRSPQASSDLLQHHSELMQLHPPCKANLEPGNNVFRCPFHYKSNCSSVTCDLAGRKGPEELSPPDSGVTEADESGCPPDTGLGQIGLMLKDRTTCNDCSMEDQRSRGVWSV